MTSEPAPRFGEGIHTPPRNGDLDLLKDRIATSYRSICRDGYALGEKVESMRAQVDEYRRKKEGVFGGPFLTRTWKRIAYRLGRLTPEQEVRTAKKEAESLVAEYDVLIAGVHTTHQKVEREYLASLGEMDRLAELRALLDQGIGRVAEELAGVREEIAGSEACEPDTLRALAEQRQRLYREQRYLEELGRQKKEVELRIERTDLTIRGQKQAMDDVACDLDHLHIEKYEAHESLLIEHGIYADTSGHMVPLARLEERVNHCVQEYTSKATILKEADDLLRTGIHDALLSPRTRPDQPRNTDMNTTVERLAEERSRRVDDILRNHQRDVLI